LDVAAADQSRPSATRAAKLIDPMRRIFIPHLGKMGLAHFSPSECEALPRGSNRPAPPKRSPPVRYSGSGLTGTSGMLEVAQLAPGCFAPGIT
jgi:hypothetical protein